MKISCSLCIAGAALWAYCSVTSAALVSVYGLEDFESVPFGNLTQWNFNDVHAGTPTLDTHPNNFTLDGGGPIISPTRFLGEFGQNDVVHLNLNAPQKTTSVRIEFDAYLLRTWDGQGVTYAGPDIFGYGIAGQKPIVENSFSNGQGNQDYCPFLPSPCEPTTASDPVFKNKLGFEILIAPGPGGPPKGTDMSLVYHFDSGPIGFTGSQLTFNFFSKNLQPHDPSLDGLSRVSDESWGLDNVVVTAITVPEPQTWALVLTGLLFLSYAVLRRRPSR